MKNRGSTLSGEVLSTIFTPFTAARVKTQCLDLERAEAEDQRVPAEDRSPLAAATFSIRSVSAAAVIEAAEVRVTSVASRPSAS